MDLFSAIFNAVANKRNRESNEQMQREANLTNLKIARETNALNQQLAREANEANAEQAELAYKRSLPVAQVASMMNAGMSKSAALSALSGGGSYTAPAAITSQAQAATVQAPQGEATQINTDIDSIIERLSAVPANATQVELLKEQVSSLKQEQEHRALEEQRREEAHQAAMDKEKYDKWTREKKDEFFSLLENTSQEKDIQPKDGQSMHEYIRALGLQDHPLYKALPASARTDAFDDYLKRMDENRAKHQEERLRAAEQRAIAAEQRAKEKHNLDIQHMRDVAKDYRDERDARVKEYRLRELRAQFDIFNKQEDLKLADYQHNLEFDSDGNLKFSRKASEKFKRAWNRLADTVGLSIVKDLLSGLVSISTIK